MDLGRPAEVEPIYEPLSPPQHLGQLQQIAWETRRDTANFTTAIDDQVYYASSLLGSALAQQENSPARDELFTQAHSALTEARNAINSANRHVQHDAWRQNVSVNATLADLYVLADEAFLTTVGLRGSDQRKQAYAHYSDAYVAAARGGLVAKLDVCVRAARGMMAVGASEKALNWKEAAYLHNLTPAWLGGVALRHKTMFNEARIRALTVSRMISGNDQKDELIRMYIDQSQYAE